MKRIPQIDKPQNWRWPKHEDDQKYECNPIFNCSTAPNWIILFSVIICTSLKSEKTCYFLMFLVFSTTIFFLVFLIFGLSLVDGCLWSCYLLYSCLCFCIVKFQPRFLDDIGLVVFLLFFCYYKNSELFSLVQLQV